MNTLRTLFLLGGILMLMTPSLALAKDLTVTVTDIDTSRPGQIMVMYYGEDGFPKDHAKAISIQTQNVSENTKTMRFQFNIDRESFAFKILHDEDMTGEVGKNWTGIIPSEGLGFSNGATLGFGPPSFKKAVLQTNETGAEIIIPIIYP
jgi:uncharacterized protein (DUF2141 family)